MIYHEERLEGVDRRLVSVIRGLCVDVVIVCGVRDEAAQCLAVAEKRSKIKWPQSKHNVCPPERDCSEAVDVCPHPVDWAQTERFYMLAGAIKQEALKQGIPIRWGGDWDGDGDVRDQTFNDLGHFEIKTT